MLEKILYDFQGGRMLMICFLGGRAKRSSWGSAASVNLGIGACVVQRSVSDSPGGRVHLYEWGRGRVRVVQVGIGERRV